jgi:hypothetical protein
VVWHTSAVQQEHDLKPPSRNLCMRQTRGDIEKRALLREAEPSAYELLGNALMDTLIEKGLLTARDIQVGRGVIHSHSMQPGITCVVPAPTIRVLHGQARTASLLSPQCYIQDLPCSP